jgi:polar amino acid transport system substrate-binding protein
MTGGPVDATSVADLKASGKIKIGIQGDNPPWGFVGPDGAQSGFDADIGRLFARSLGVVAKFVPLQVADRIPALIVRQVHVLFATMAMTAERAKFVQYSKPYVANIIYLVGAGTDAIAGPADWRNLVIGVPTSSIQDTQITKKAPAGTKIVRFADDAATIGALLAGEVQAVGGNMFYIDRLNAARPGVYENKIELTRLHNGACTRLGDKELNAALNAFIDRIAANGDLADAYAKWMKVPVPAFASAIDGVPFAAN